MLELRPAGASCSSVPTNGKQCWRGRVSASVLFRKPVSGALPVVQLLVNGRRCQVLIDTGCTDTTVHAPRCAQWQPRMTIITTISGDIFQCIGVSKVTVETSTGLRAQMQALVVSEPPWAWTSFLAL